MPDPDVSLPAEGAADERVHPPSKSVPLEPSVRGLENAYIERVDRPLAGLYALSLVLDTTRCVLLLAAGPPRARPAWALVAVRPRGEAADAQVRGLREKFEGARLASFDASSGGWSLVAQRGAQRWRLEGRRDGAACLASPPPEEGGGVGGGADAGRLAEAWRRGQSFVAEQRRLEGERAKADALASLRRARAKLARRIAAVEGDLEAAERAQGQARRAAPFVAAAARAPRGASKLEAIDWSSGEAEGVTFELDATRPAREQLEAIFARARRLRAGAPKAEARRDEATLALWRLDEAAPAIEAAEGAAAVEALVGALARELPRDLPLRAPAPSPPRERRGEAPAREPFRRYEGEGGASILVGRDAASNDELTTRVARPGDLWVHAKDGAGSHVVVPGGYKGGSPDARVLVDAAALAAHFSSLRGEAIVDVIYADRRHVRKRKGSPRGAVEVQKFKALALRAEPTRLARLLATGRAPG